MKTSIVILAVILIQGVLCNQGTKKIGGGTYDDFGGGYNGFNDEGKFGNMLTKMMGATDPRLRGIGGFNDDTLVNVGSKTFGNRIIRNTVEQKDTYTGTGGRMLDDTNDEGLGNYEGGFGGAKLGCRCKGRIGGKGKIAIGFNNFDMDGELGGGKTHYDIHNKDEERCVFCGNKLTHDGNCLYCM